ncbi:TPA: hypothetical protein ACIBZA_002913 [Salmonella enterica subsp. enterica serovar Java]
MKLARNAVYAITTEFNNANNFVHINKTGKLIRSFLRNTALMFTENCAIIQRVYTSIGTEQLIHSSA